MERWAGGEALQNLSIVGGKKEEGIRRGEVPTNSLRRSAHIISSEGGKDEKAKNNNLL